MKSSKVLIVDDDASLRRVIEFTLSQEGYKVLAAAEGEEALRLFATERPHLVLTDIQMAGLSGLELVKRIKSDSPETPVIVITAFGTVENAVEAMKMGACDFIPKPFSQDHLRLVVNKALAWRGLQEEISRLRERIGSASAPDFVAGSEKMQAVLALVRRVAATEATVLVTGESGTGKELIARALHEHSDRREGAFVPVNCAAIPAELLESELFGHLKGAFTGAIRDRRGKFEQADGGTIFLDEVGELPLDLQPKLLRVLQEREIEPVGGRPSRVNVRVIAATNRDLEVAMANGEFRDDLYYRLAVVPVQIPPLRRRREDIPVLVAHFLKKHRNGQELSLSTETMKRLVAYDWPGNVRELENIIERMVILARGGLLEESDLPPRVRLNRRFSKGILNLPAEGYSLEELEKEAIVEALLRNDWNQTRAAAFLRIPRHILTYRMDKFDIRR